jgi:hypothetical protein
MPNRSLIFRFADVEVREREFSLIKAGEALPVEPKAFRVLLFLLRSPQNLIYSWSGARRMCMMGSALGFLVHLRTKKLAITSGYPVKL